ncbi:MAG: hypothetical protein WCG65_10320, partial [Actinomycetes bacterium]
MNSTRTFFVALWKVFKLSPGAILLGLMGNILFLLGHLVTPLIIGKIIELAIPGGQRSELWS